MTTTVIKLTGTGTWVVPAEVTSLSSLLVIGGGGGGGGTPDDPWPAGGGGAGQARLFTDVAVTPGESISYSVGAGGAGGAVGAQNQGTDGSSTTFDTVTATGGGGGGSDTVGRGGGSGGGGSGNRAGGAAADADFGKDGGAGSSAGPGYYGGGGGGFGAAGASGATGGNGGAGIDASSVFSAHGDSGWFAAGGAGGHYLYETPGVGGQGGGGDAGDGTITSDGGNALADTGSGGAGAGGGGSWGGKGGDGASGVILIAYAGEVEDVDAYVSVPGPLAAPALYGISDWTQSLPPLAQIYYACELQLSGDSERLPISSWQATIQNDRASYLQAVVPAATSRIGRINALAGGDLVIFRGVRLDDDVSLELEMARVPLGEVNYQQGPTNATATLSGYGQINFQAVDPEDPGASRTLAGIRSISIQSGYRVRADIDWLLRPGMTAVANGASFTVAYMNFYVTGGQAYMDVGERTL